MSIFICAVCDTYADSDEGCEEYKLTRLICAACISEREHLSGDDKWEPADAFDPGDRTGAFRND